jgi:hypothetical protein
MLKTRGDGVEKNSQASHWEGCDGVKEIKVD